MTTKDIAYNGVIAAIYVALTLISTPISYGPIQFRISEILVLLVFFKKNYIFGICLGTAIANFGSTLSMIDVVFGTIATLIACICMMHCKHLLIAIIYPVAFNGVIIGLEIAWLSGFKSFMESYFLPSLQVAAGELLVMLCGYLLFMLLKRRQDFKEILNADQNVDFKF